ncbi:hypothetical protein P12x_000220 [Tundrisphaera lichenicola]|uniref:hypothetical protein n=1 Tax=Tundrisphaera lichenicola TaxID=2029860 RepID=UPI003EC1394F
MRTGRRVHRLIWLHALFVALAGAAPISPREAPAGLPVRMTFELRWSVPVLPDLPEPEHVPAIPGPIELTMGAGVVNEVVPWPTGPAWESRPDGSWRQTFVNQGQARVRVEAPLAAEITIRVADQVARLTLASLLEGPHHSGSPAVGEIKVERLAWDAIQADLAGDGTLEPGAAVPLSVSLNLLTPEAADVAVRCSAELRPARGGDPIWRDDWKEVIATNSLEPARHPLMVTAKGPEGTYILEIKTSWEPMGDPAGSRLGRWLRRRRNPSQTTSASRRLSVAILGPRSPASPTPTKGDSGESEVDAIDLTRAWGQRPSATGRSPLAEPGRTTWLVPDAAMVDPSVRDRLRGWIKGNATEPSTLAPADSGGLAWSAVGLRVENPERPHRLTLTVTGGHPSSLGVAMVAGGGPGSPGRVVLDACVSGAPVLDGGPPGTFSWPVWPDAESPVLVMVNRDRAASVRIGSISLTELTDLPASAAPRGPDRSLGIHLAGLRSLARFGGGNERTIDILAQGRNLSTYLAHCGASTVILPNGLADRQRRRALSGQAGEDSTGPDRLDLMLRILARRGCSAWVEVGFGGTLPGLPAPNSPEAMAEGLVRLDRKGLADGPSYHPIHPKVREAMARKVRAAVEPRKARPNLLGVLVRLGPSSTLLGGPDTGLDDTTFARFVDDAFEPGLSARVPGQDPGDPGRFEARAKYVEGAGRLPWLAWRSREVAGVYAGLAEAARSASPGSTLAVATPGLEPGPAGEEARRVDLAGLGPSQAWRGVGLDLTAWPEGEGAPVILRGVGLSTGDLGHDLATSPELDEQVAPRAGRGVLVGVEGPVDDPAEWNQAPLRLTARPMAEGAWGDEPLGHAIAAIDARRVILASTSVAGQEERIRRFARVFSPLPSPPPGPPGPRLPSGVVSRAVRSGPNTYLSMANDTPYPILLETAFEAPADASVEDLGRGIRLEPEREAGVARLVLELPPFGVATAKVGSPAVKVASVTPFPGPAVLDGMKAHYDDLWAALGRLNRLPAGDPNLTLSRSGPSNAGFEPDSVLLTTSRPSTTIPGWETATGGGLVELDRDRPRSGRGSLRLDARNGPAGVISTPFHPDGRSTLAIHAWFRADPPDTKVRVRIDGQAEDRPYARQLDLTAQADWAETTIRATQLPEGGLDSARLRFELLGPGRLWIDDVSVRGDALSESERLNARRDLMAALSAYRDKRYSDFARLAGSHWTRYVSSGPASTVGAGDRSGMIRTGDASALPPGKRLR